MAQSNTDRNCCAGNVPAPGAGIPGAGSGAGATSAAGTVPAAGVSAAQGPVVATAREQGFEGVSEAGTARPVAVTPRGALGEGTAGDPVASLTLAIVAIVCLLMAWVLPWWVMEARAPQYGQRTLVVEVGPFGVRGDVGEVDGLGHYVGIKPMKSLAKLEMQFAPLGLLLVALGLLATPWLGRRSLRLITVLPALMMPIVFLTDVDFWMNRAVNDRNPDAALSLTVSTIDAKLIGQYEVGQFKVKAHLAGGIAVASVAGLLGLGLIFARPLGRQSCGAHRVGLALVVGLALLHAAAASGASTASRAGPGPADGPASALGPVARALARASPGDTVRVPRGVHREHLVVTTPRVHLIGEPGAVLDGGGEGTILRIEAPGVEVRDLVIRSSGECYTTEDAGVRVHHAPDVTLRGLAIEDTLFGVFVAQGDRALIDACRIVGKDLPDVRRGDSIRLWYSSNTRITHNRVERSRDVVIWYSSGTVFEDNVVRTSRYGLHYMYSNKNSFRRNRFEDNQVGATVMNSRGIELSENSFSFSSGIAAYGLLVKDADDVFITHNRFVGNTTGIYLDDAPQSRGGRLDVHANLIARNDVGVALQPLTRGVRFWENTFIGNAVPVGIEGGGSAQGDLWSVEGRGNYWSDALVYDPDRTGVSRLPYSLEDTYEVLADRHPQLMFYAATPAAEAIDMASRLFPIFAPRPRVSDAHPLTRPVLGAWATGPDVPAPDGRLAVAGGTLLALAAVAAGAARRMAL